MSAAKAALRPLYDALIFAVPDFGFDIEIAPKKARVSLRRHKQFALIERASAKRLQLGINLADAAPTDRLLMAGGLCTHKVSVTSPAEVDDELLGWLRAAYEGNGPGQAETDTEISCSPVAPSGATSAVADV